ncbi:hypothetical protein SAMN05421858_3466 [Haladaptatus litoreus]|uniref:Uncharacterized protein n=2 Tax=Haladaptatus litoreus TaxID=553468 RepID=A0A1N7DAR0_9EURY|nr:hypothetical protein SAMN05421858_3466 [Haladaptatus litoreus]
MTDDWTYVDTGAPDQDLMKRARTVAEEYEPLITDSEFDNALNPETLHLYVEDGITTDEGRFDITWTDKHYYRYHYTEGDDFNYRYDYHPRRNLPTNHFHEPPDATHGNAVPSCIEVTAVRLVTLAVLQLWRDAVDADDLTRLQQPNPP